MITKIKIIFTVIAVILSIAIYSIPSSSSFAGSNRFWRGGKDDPFRNALFQTDGSFRKYTKLFIILWFYLCLGVLWLFV